MTKGILITGTDTDVGKTFVGCLIAKEMRASEIKVGVMKPAESDCRDGKPKDSLALKEASGTDTDLDIINPYRFEPAIAPTVAAERQGDTISFDKIKECYHKIASTHDRVIVEGSGGLLVPIGTGADEGGTIVALALELNLDVIIVSASKLGVLNHTFLTAYTAAQMGLNIRGIVLNHMNASSDQSDSYNLDEIKKTGLKVVSLPYSKDGTTEVSFKEIYE